MRYFLFTSKRWRDTHTHTKHGNEIAEINGLFIWNAIIWMRRVIVHQCSVFDLFVSSDKIKNTKNTNSACTHRHSNNYKRELHKRLYSFSECVFYSHIFSFPLCLVCLILYAVKGSSYFWHDHSFHVFIYP